MNRSTGIYEIRNTLNDSRYIGSAVNFRKRWNEHRRLLRGGCHHAGHLQNSWTKHGEAAFEFRKMLICSKANLIMYEQAAMDAMRPEYNIAPTAGSNAGIKRSDEFRLKAAQGSRGNTNKRGKKCSPETRAKMSASRLGRKHSAESKAKMSALLLGHKRCLGYRHTEETKRKMSVAQLGKRNGLGHKHSEETRAKMSVSAKAARARRKLS